MPTSIHERKIHKVQEYPKNSVLFMCINIKTKLTVQNDLIAVDNILQNLIQGMSHM